MSDARKFLIESISMTGKTQEGIAKKLRIKPSTFRASLNKGRIPESALREFTNTVKVTEKELKANGVKVSRKYKRSRRSTVSSKSNVLPVIVAIAGSGLKQVTLNQVKRLIVLSSTLKMDLTPRLVRELLKCMSK